MVEDVARSLEGLGGVKLVRPDYKVRGAHLDATLPPEKLRGFATVLREKEFLLEAVTCVDADPERMAVYHFVHPSTALRVIGRVLVERTKSAVPSIQEIFPGANWHERETHEFFGLVFEGHPDLSNLILPEDAGDLRPLRKSDETIKALGAVIPEFAPPAPEGAAEGEAPAKPRPPKKEKEPSAEGES